MASGPRDIFVPASGAELARELLGMPEPDPHAPSSEGTPAWVKALAVALAVGTGGDHRRRGLRRRLLVTRRLLLPGGVVLAVGIASFMRAPLLPEIGRDL